jgi:hypothetical protein
VRRVIGQRGRSLRPLSGRLGLARATSFDPEIVFSIPRL